MHFTTEYWHFVIEWFESLIWSNELKIYIDSDALEDYVRRSEEKVLPESMKTMVEYGNDGIMVSEAFSSCGVDKLIWCDKDIEAK